MSEIRVEEEYHNLVRPLSEKEFADLRDSIKTHGLLVPITVSQNGIIVDGHNRYKICQELGIKPLIIRKEFASTTVEKLFVIEANLKRRHLTDIEKIELGMQLEPIAAELAQRRADEGHRLGGSVKHHGESARGSNEHQAEKSKTRDLVAKQIGVSPSAYQRGKTVLEEGSEAIKEEVKAGKKSVSAAYDEIKGRDKKTKKQAAESSDILMLPEDKYQATKDAIDEAIAVHDKQVVLRHNKHKVISVGKEIEISSV